MPAYVDHILASKPAPRRAKGAVRAKVLKANQVWTTRSADTRTPSRRVINVAHGKVCYSSGSAKTHWCKLRAFRLWIRRHKAVATRTRRARTLALRQETIA